jgi:hypothetical protein
MLAAPKVKSRLLFSDTQTRLYFLATDLSFAGLAFKLSNEVTLLKITVKYIEFSLCKRLNLTFG